jgi:hypothetical protein
MVGFIVAAWTSFLISKFRRFLLQEDVYDRLKLSRGVHAQDGSDIIVP